MSTLRDRIEEVIEYDVRFTPSFLARAAGVSSGAVSQWRSGQTRQLKAESALGLEAATRFRAEWLATGALPKRVFHTPQDQREDHPVSLSAHEDPPLVSWEGIMNAYKRPKLFRVELIDDAMAPLAPRGTICTFEDRAPQFGDAVLVRDNHGAMHLRVYTQRPGGGFNAVPTNRAYATLSSLDHGLSVVAVFTGLAVSWAQLMRA